MQAPTPLQLPKNQLFMSRANVAEQIIKKLTSQHKKRK